MEALRHTGAMGGMVEVGGEMIPVAIEFEEMIDEANGLAIEVNRSIPDPSRAFRHMSRSRTYASIRADIIRRRIELMRIAAWRERFMLPVPKPTSKRRAAPVVTSIVCPDCDGNRWIDGRECPACGGEGWRVVA